jgi:HSP20 family protein
MAWDAFADSFRILERFGGRFLHGWKPDGEQPDQEDDSGSLVPRADMYDCAEGLTIEVELSGVMPGDVTVHVAGDSIVVEAERKFARNGRRVVQLETSYGRLRRQFVLPIRSLPHQAVAELRSGFLRIVVPRSPSARTGLFPLQTTGGDESHNVPVA